MVASAGFNFPAKSPLSLSLAWQQLILVAFIVGPTSSPAITTGGAFKHHVGATGIRTASMATMKKTVWCQVLKALHMDIHARLINSLVMMAVGV